MGNDLIARMNQKKNETRPPLAETRQGEVRGEVLLLSTKAHAIDSIFAYKGIHFLVYVCAFLMPIDFRVLELF
jgi:hypothetical protein